MPGKGPPSDRHQCHAYTMILSDPISARPPPAAPALAWHRHGAWELLQFALAMALLVVLAYQGAQQMAYQWKWEKVPGYLVRVIDGQWLAGPLLKGLYVTLQLAWQSALLALLLGVLGAWMRVAPSRVGRALAWSYVELIRNTPLLVQILVCYFILAPTLGLGREATGVLCLALYEGAFATEIIRGALQAVPRGQREAALSLGLSDAQAERDIVNATKKKIEWGSQIRNYVLQPYRMVKDVRTNMETGDTDSFLDGRITPFMEAFLAGRANGTLGEGGGGDE